ncbi:putative disease resistance protein RGA1 [Eucalyptus grandis]|uniref:putative disease resistance protein RGA1 n=1 Tax=Eucalyptus grandis TaxID=71139 RepID=UPI00192E98FF|nr:putative disease resistance protein RGA1 [Eucalyptus grandis]
MAEAVISIAGSILANLITEALQKVGKLGGIKHELKELKSTVSMIGAMLDDAEKRYHQSYQIKDWVEKLKEVFYDAQDVLEEFNVEATRQELRGNNVMIEEVRTFFSSSNQLAFALKISRKVRAVRERMVAIKAEKELHLVEQPMDLQAEIEREREKETYSFTCVKDIIGRDNDKRKVMEFLLDLDVKERVSILPIVSIGGLGKTTLAQCVYNDETEGLGKQDPYNHTPSFGCGNYGLALPYHLKGLSESVSLDLLMQMARQKEEKIQDLDMLAIGKEMVKECFGGSLDYEIEKRTLVNLWMAEGFIRPSNGSQHLEDIAHEYFVDLLWRNFFQEFQEDGETCKMHDLMHDLACSVAGTECWVAWDDTKPIHERTRHISCDSTSNLMGEPLKSCLKASALRTFLSVTRYWGREPTSEADLRQLIQSFKRLRILHLHAADVKKVPRFICKLKHLTYLDLSGNDALKRLPNSITRLHNLQTLNLCSCRSLEELPRGIRKLVSLRNLNIDYCDQLSYMPCGLGQLSSLHRLSCFILPKDKALAKKYCGLGELNRLNNIRGRLFIENLGSVIDAVKESKAANLREKGSLEFLILSWGIFNITDEAMISKRDEALLDGLRRHDNLQELIIDGYNGESFRRWMTELPNLVGLALSGCERCKHFPQFGLSKLKRLNISDMKFLEYLPGSVWKVSPHLNLLVSSIFLG